MWNISSVSKHFNSRNYNAPPPHGVTLATPHGVTLATLTTTWCPQLSQALSTFSTHCSQNYVWWKTVDSSSALAAVCVLGESSEPWGVHGILQPVHISCKQCNQYNQYKQHKQHKQYKAAHKLYLGLISPPTFVLQSLPYFEEVQLC